MVGVCGGVSIDDNVGVGSLDLTKLDVGSCARSKRTMRTWWKTPVPGCWVPQVHRACEHNEVEALKLRLLGSALPREVFGPLDQRVQREFDRMCAFSRKYTGGRWSLEETADSYSGLLRRRYREACRSLREEGPVNSKDAKIKAFLKAEKVNVGPKWAKPRLICPRSPRYNLALASFLKPFEHWLWGRLDGKFIGGGQGRIVAKGLNPARRGRLIAKKFGSFRKCVVFEADGKAFEAHVGPAQVLAEHSVYKTAFPSRELAELLRYQENLTGRLECGARFKRPGGRASGDFNTGMGNTIIMLCVVAAVMRSFGVRFDVLVDGDNCLVFLESDDLPVVLAEFADRSRDWSGQELVLERPVHVMEEIRFGQSAPVYLGKSGWTMVRDYRKVLSGATSSHKWLREPLYATRYLQGVARCELSLSRGVPVLQSWSLSMLGISNTAKVLKEDPFADYFVVGAWFADEGDAVPVSTEARISFERAFGIGVEEQKRLESSFKLPQGQEYRRFEGYRDWTLADPGLMETWAEETCL